MRDAIFWGASNHISGFKGSQAVPACLSGRGDAYDQNQFFLCDVGRATLERNVGLRVKHAVKRGISVFFPK
jgi:hypothetical protein